MSPRCILMCVVVVCSQIACSGQPEDAAVDPVVAQKFVAQESDNIPAFRTR